MFMNYSDIQKYMYALQTFITLCTDYNILILIC